MKKISRKIYEDWYNIEYKSNSIKSVFGEARDEVVEFITYLKKGTSVIELGCGDGRNIDKLLEKELMVTGVDLINKEILNNKFSNNDFEYIQDDIMNINLEKNKYFSLLCTEVLHMFSKEEICKILENSMNSIQNNGYII